MNTIVSLLYFSVSEVLEFYILCYLTKKFYIYIDIYINIIINWHSYSHLEYSTLISTLKQAGIFKSIIVWKFNVIASQFVNILLV